MPVRSGEDVCGVCGYDFEGVNFRLDHRCPECGLPARSLVYVPSFSTVINKPGDWHVLLAFLLNGALGIAVCSGLFGYGLLNLLAGIAALGLIAVSMYNVHRLSGHVQTQEEARRISRLAVLPGVIALFGSLIYLLL
ncbi:MAG: hypothetical protein AAGA55_05425 [Planctomycetota bacterium]